MFSISRGDKLFANIKGYSVYFQPRFPKAVQKYVIPGLYIFGPTDHSPKEFLGTVTFRDGKLVWLSTAGKVEYASLFLWGVRHEFKRRTGEFPHRNSFIEYCKSNFSNAEGKWVAIRGKKIICYTFYNIDEQYFVWYDKRLNKTSAVSRFKIINMKGY